MWYEQKSGDQHHVALMSQSLRAAIGPLQFLLRHWNLRNLTLHSGMLAYKSLEIFSASPGSRLRSAGSLKIIIIIFKSH